MSNGFRKYCLGLSTRGGDQRPLSRGRRPAAAEGVSLHAGNLICECLSAFVCTFPRVDVQQRRLWGGLEVSMGLLSCSRPPVLGLERQRAAPAFAVLQLWKGSS